MKKVIFMALATVFMLSSGFSSLNEVDSEEFYPCAITSTDSVYDIWTGETTTTTTTYTINTDGFFDCMELRQAIATIEAGNNTQL